ncbi:Zn-dependent exopeptidase [Wolfiporia cocos MD-104 SS10]|uniref:Zn-dependent exopeptidase n=1 Tax=Wolfiporia cocos (strain MD-104) TaxID=742152 RepID=A0A2H3JGA3_WOLCO|nr:Zn-dependent exopeptidase [Wolfiporia cocos MD-104 SS10]
MASEKSDAFIGKQPAESIPVPAVATSPPRKRLRRRKLLLTGLIFTVLTYALCCKVHQIGERIAAHEGTWLAKAFGEHIPQKVKPHGKILFGKAAEKVFLTVPNPASALAASRQYATSPHLAGSEGDYKTATDFLALLHHELGIDPPEVEPVFSAGSPESRNATLSISSLNGPTAWIDTYYPVMNTPLERKLEILDDDGNAIWTADLEEVADETDPEAGKYSDAVPTFHGLSRDGEAKGKLVYAHYGRKQDYDALEALGVDLTGSIVITRYGGVFRGLKVKGAQEHGAVACLIYSDPRDDGTVTEENGYEPYPNGPARNPTSVQRGSTQFLSIYPGDPTTPGYPSYENSTRTPGTNIPTIPSLPISWANAQVLLEEIEEGGKNRTVSLVNHVDDRVIPIWNTMGVIPGHIKDEVVVIGNHRDAWVMGASDPSSGTASIHEVIRGLGVLLRQGWKPLRTILIASWDAEEYGLIGSTEWGEDFAEWIGDYVVAYLNLDSSVSGSRFYSSASPSFAHFLRSAAEEIPHPTKPGLTLWDATQDKGPLYGSHIDAEALALYEEVQAQFAANELGVGVLGSGSDYTVFLQRIGVASTNHGFQSTLSDPVYHYHSVFDSQRWQELYADPGFLKHVAVAKFLGLQTLRLADAIVLPLNTTYYTLQLDEYLDRVQLLADASSLHVDFAPLRESISSLRAASEALDVEKADAEHELKHVLRRVVRREFVRRHLGQAWCKIRKVFGKPCKPHKHEDSDHKHAYLLHDRPLPAPRTGKRDGRSVKPRVGRFAGWLREQRAREHEAHACHVRPHGGSDDKLRKQLEHAVRRVRAVNKKLVAFERGFIHPDGIKDREWYRHLGVAPGKWLGYGATTLPGLTEAVVFEADAEQAQFEAQRVTELLQQLAEEIKV